MFDGLFDGWFGINSALGGGVSGGAGANVGGGVNSNANDIWGAVNNTTNTTHIPAITNAVVVSGAKRTVLLKGSVVVRATEYLIVPITLATVKSAITNALVENGFDVVSVSLSGNSLTYYDLAVECRVLTKYTAEQARASAKSVISSINDRVVVQSVILNVVSDFTGTTTINNTTSSSNNNATGAGSGDISGIVPKGADWLSEMLFGKKIDIAGVQVPQWLIIGGVIFYLTKK